MADTVEVPAGSTPGVLDPNLLAADIESYGASVARIHPETSPA